MKHGIILPLKESFNLSNAGAVAIWVKDYLKYSKYKKNIHVFTSTTSSQNLIYNKNIFKIKLTTKILSNINYIEKISKILKKKNFTSVEIHNRPEYAKYLIKNNPELKINLIFHNDPNTIRQSNSIDKKNFLIEKCTKIIFVSEYLKKCFFNDLNINHKNNTLIVYNAIDKLKKFPKKEKIIIFTGKLNSSKGYHIFGESIIKILDIYPEWKAIVIGNEPREKYFFKHPRLIIYDWMSHKKIMNFFKKASISVVNPTWDEPFGRTALESASRGCAVITSISGGLQETFHNNLVLKENNIKCLTNLLSKLINNPKFLKSKQFENFSNVKHDIIKKALIIDKLHFDQLSKKFKVNYFKKKYKRILHISTFGEKLDFRTFNISISKKITNGLIRNGHDVVNFDYRDYKNKLLNNIDDKILNIVENYRPDLILFGHNNSLNRETLSRIKKTNNCKLSIWYEDHVVKGDPSYRENLNLLEKNNDLIDNYFITTHPSKIKTKIKKNKLHFCPIPVDPSIEIGEFYNVNKNKDLFFALSHGVNYGKLKKNSRDERFDFINKLINNNENLSFNILGLYNEQPKWNFNFLEELKICKTSLNLSRGGPNKYATSNRLATLAGNGCVVLIDKNVEYQDFFSDKEMFFYKNLNDLSNNLENLCNDKKKLQSMAMRLKKRYFEIFSNNIVSDYIIHKNFNVSNFKKYAWD